MADKRKTLPPVAPTAPREIRQFLETVREIMETGEGVRGNPLDKKLTYRDLIDLDMIRLRDGLTPGASANPGNFIPNDPNDIRDVPPRPQDFAAHGSFYGYIYLSWRDPQSQYGNHGYANVYRHTVDNFADAQIIGREDGFFYSDQVRNDVLKAKDPKQLQGYYYWITFVSSSGVEGPPNDPAGTFARPLADIGYVMDLLSGKGNDRLPMIEDNGIIYINTAMIRQAAIQEGQLGPITIGKLFLKDGTPVTTIGGLIRADAIDVDNIRVTTAMIKDAAITRAKIADASITRAKIGRAEIDTLLVAGNAITVPVAAQSRDELKYPKEDNNKWVDLQTLYMDPEGGNITVSVSALFDILITSTGMSSRQLAAGRTRVVVDGGATFDLGIIGLGEVVLSGATNNANSYTKLDSRYTAVVAIGSWSGARRVRFQYYTQADFNRGLFSYGAVSQRTIIAISHKR